VVLVALRQMAAKVQTQFFQQLPPQVEDLVKEKALAHRAMVVRAVARPLAAQKVLVMKAGFLPLKVMTAAHQVATAVAVAVAQQPLEVMETAQVAQVEAVVLHQ
jgi:hypothetical protein